METPNIWWSTHEILHVLQASLRSFKASSKRTSGRRHGESHDAARGLKGQLQETGLQGMVVTYGKIRGITCGLPVV